MPILISGSPPNTHPTTVVCAEPKAPNSLNPFQPCLKASSFLLILYNVIRMTFPKQKFNHISTHHMGISIFPVSIFQ